MKRLRRAVILFFFALPLSVSGQVTLFPKVDHVSRTEQAEVMRVEVTGSFTIIDFLLHPNASSVEGGNWGCVDKSTYITPTGREERKFLVMAHDITICPRMTKIREDANDPFIFRLYFPPLEKDILKIDIVSRKMQLRGVNLSNIADYPAADSATYRSQEAFRRYFLAHRDRLDPIEGLWHLQIRRQHYLGSGTYLEEESLPPIVVAILKNGEVFDTYDDTGRNRREYFKKLSGKKGYFFRSVFPEVEGEASAYTFFSRPDRFYLKYLLPDRLAHYYVPGEYVPGMKMMEIAEYTRIPLTGEEPAPPVFDLGKDTTDIHR